MYFNLVFFSTAAAQVSGETSAWINQYSYVYTSSFTATYLNLFTGNRWFDSSTNSIFFFGFSGFSFTPGTLGFVFYQSTRTYYVDVNVVPIRLSGNLFALPSKICPLLYPYYNSVLDLCSSICLVAAGTDYSCSSIPYCPSNCDTCSNSTVCTACSSNYFLRNDNLCYSSCLAGTFSSSSNRTCVTCPNGCATCSSLTLCLTCSSSPTSYFLRVDNLCYTSCLDGYYA